MLFTDQVGELERLATGLMIEIMEFPRTWKPTILVLRLTLLTKMITMSSRCTGCPWLATWRPSRLKAGRWQACLAGGTFFELAQFC